MARDPNFRNETIDKPSGVNLKHLIEFSLGKNATAEQVEGFARSKGATAAQARRAANAYSIFQDSDREFLVSKSGFDVVGPRGVETMSGRGKGDKKGFQITDLVGLGRNMSTLTGVFATELDRYKKDLEDTITKDAEEASNVPLEVPVSDADTSVDTKSKDSPPAKSPSRAKAGGTSAPPADGPVEDSKPSTPEIGVPDLLRNTNTTTNDFTTRGADNARKEIDRKKVVDAYMFASRGTLGDNTEFENKYKAAVKDYFKTYGEYPEISTNEVNPFTSGLIRGREIPLTKNPVRKVLTERLRSLKELPTKEEFESLRNVKGITAGFPTFEGQRKELPKTFEVPSVLTNPEAAKKEKLKTEVVQLKQLLDFYKGHDSKTLNQDTVYLELRDAYNKASKLLSSTKK